MKSKTWALILGLVLALCLVLSLVLYYQKGSTDRAEIWVDGECVRRVDLSEDQTFSLKTEYGTNVISVRDGEIAVTEADCPDHYCVKRGYCSGGVPIVCLPNRLEIRFPGEQNVDGAVG